MQSDLNSFLWLVDRDPPAYFFGTIHVPYKKVWDYIPENSKQAFDQSESVFFELDLTNPYTISALAKCQLLPHGENLSNVLPKDIYKRLKRHLEYVRVMMPLWMTADQRGRGLYADYLFDSIAGNWERKRPVWVMLMVNSLTESDIKSRGIPVLDLYLAQEAERTGKITGAVERVDEQCVPLNELNFSQVLFALNQTLWQHESYRQRKNAMPYTTDDLIQHYNCGDLNSIIFNHDTAQVPNLLNTSVGQADVHMAKVIDDYFRIELIDKRNQRMVERVLMLLERHPNTSFFFAFGAGHFLGNSTVIDRLRSAGLKVDHIQPADPIPKLRINKKHKNRRKKQKEYPFGDLWYLDPETRMWLEKQQKRRRKKFSHREKPFNDLWVRMDSHRRRPNLMRQLAEEHYYNSKAVVWTTPKYQANIQNTWYHGGAPPLQSQVTRLTVMIICLLKVLDYH
ncbi:hypothetical protein ScPMuIL_005253 [Solemya velum]